MQKKPKRSRTNGKVGNVCATQQLVDAKIVVRENCSLFRWTRLTIQTSVWAGRPCRQTRGLEPVVGSGSSPRASAWLDHSLASLFIGRQWTDDRCVLLCNDCPLTCVSAAMCSSDDIDWPVHCLMLCLRGLLLRRLTSTSSPCSITFSNVSWCQTWPNYN